MKTANDSLEYPKTFFFNRKNVQTGKIKRKFNFTARNKKQENSFLSFMGSHRNIYQYQITIITKGGK